jgi:hypothetical protein
MSLIEGLQGMADTASGGLRGVVRAEMQKREWKMTETQNKQMQAYKNAMLQVQKRQLAVSELTALNNAQPKPETEANVMAMVIKKAIETGDWSIYERIKKAEKTESSGTQGEREQKRFLDLSVQPPTVPTAKEMPGFQREQTEYQILRNKYLPNKKTEEGLSLEDRQKLRVNIVKDYFGKDDGSGKIINEVMAGKIADRILGVLDPAGNVEAETDFEKYRLK